MDTEDQDQDIYGLIGKVCENLLRQQIDVAEHPYLPQKNNNKHLRKLKSKAYEILLKKSRKDYGKSNLISISLVVYNCKFFCTFFFVFYIKKINLTF